MLDSEVIDEGNGILCIEIGEEEALGIVDSLHSFKILVDGFISKKDGKDRVFFKTCADGKCDILPIDKGNLIYDNEHYRYSFNRDKNEKFSLLCIDTRGLDTDASEVIQAGRLFSGNVVLFAERVGKLFGHDKIVSIEQESYKRKGM